MSNTIIQNAGNMARATLADLGGGKSLAVCLDSKCPGAITPEQMIDQPKDSGARWMFDETARQLGINPATIQRGSAEQAQVTRVLTDVVGSIRTEALKGTTAEVHSTVRGEIMAAVAAGAKRDAIMFGAGHATDVDSQKTQTCPSGPQVNLGGGVSATGFLGLLGLSGGGGVTASVPTASLPFVGDGSFRGSQVTGSLSATPLLGLGVFLGAGPNYSLGGSSSSTPRGLSGSVTPTIQAGAGDGAGVEVSSDFTSPLSVGGSGGRIAGGAYGAVGARFQGNLSTGPIGCK